MFRGVLDASSATSGLLRRGLAAAALADAIATLNGEGSPTPPPMPARKRF